MLGTVEAMMLGDTVFLLHSVLNPCGVVGSPRLSLLWFPASFIVLHLAAS